MPDLAQRKIGGTSGVEAAQGPSAAPAVGKSTQVQAAESAGAPAPAAPGVRPPPPPEYAAMDGDLVDKLWTSRHALAVKRAAFNVPDERFWDAVASIGAADLHTLSVVTRGAKAVGVWPHVQTIVGWYTFPASYAIEFLGNPAGVATNGQWGKDFPQAMVRKEHEGTQHEWYRNASGAGNPGMHLGLDIGAGYHNVHWDPTNPMDHVGDGMPHLVPVPAVTPILVPIIEPRGMAIYSPMALIAHAGEIGKFGEGARELLKKPGTPTEKFVQIALGKDAADKATEFADLEANAQGKIDRAGSEAAVAELRRAIAGVLAVHRTAQQVAQLEDAAAKAQLDDLLTQLAAAESALHKALAGLVVFLKTEVGVTADWPFDQEAKWAHVKTYMGYDTITGLQKQRLAKRAPAP